MSKNLILYYSRKGENYYAGEIKKLAKGNTETMAEFIQEAVGGELFEIDVVDAYPEDYHACTERAQAELRENLRPAIKRGLDKLDGYDTVFLGYPNWWGSCPMGVLTFLDGCDLEGRRIIVFCTHEGSGFGRSVQRLGTLYPKARFEEGMAIEGNRTASSHDAVVAWARGIA